MSDLTNQIINNASGPASVSSDGTTITQFNPRDLAEADKYLALKKFANKPWQALRFARIVFPGATR